MLSKVLKLARSKTVIASVLGATAYLLKQPSIATPEILDAVGMVLGAAGVRDALSKVAIAAATGKPAPRSR